MLLISNMLFFQILIYELAKIFQSKREIFYIKITIWKSEKNTKYASPDLHVNANQGSDLVTINPSWVKRLKLKVRYTNTI